MTYVEILNKLKETLESDHIPENDKKEIDATWSKLFELLWKYSD